MPAKIEDRKIVVVNQAVNYLTIGICNAFAGKFSMVALITGSIHEQGEALNPQIEVYIINKYVERPARKKLLSYMKATWKIMWLLHTRFRQYEVFFVSAPPMGYLFNLVTFQRFSMLIWDVYPDALKITGMKEHHPIYWIWSRLNGLSFKKAYRLYTIGEKMADLLARYVDKNKILITPIWSIFQENGKLSKENNPFVKSHQLDGKFVIQYSGNIGLSHRVEYMVDLAERLIDHPEILFQIIGRGARRPYLETLVANKNLRNCQFLPFQSDEMFPFSLSAADVGVVILDENTGQGSVPSKTYNLMSYGIPTVFIASKDSELYHYCQKYQNGKCFLSGELELAAAFILNLHTDRLYYEKLREGALKASTEFRRSNADRIVDKYLIESNNEY